MNMPLILIVAAVLAGWGSSAQNASNQPAVRFGIAPGTSPLHEAVQTGRVKATVCGLGGSTGDAIEITVQRQVSGLLRIGLATGTVFQSGSQRSQNMVGAAIKGERAGERSYRPSSEIVLNDNLQHTYVIEAYCLDFHKDNPGRADSFSISPPTARLAELLTAARRTSTKPAVLQAALWIERDSASSNELKERFPVDDADIEAARKLLRSTETPKTSK